MLYSSTAGGVIDSLKGETFWAGGYGTKNTD
jgi:hypothetical protein